MIEARGPVDHLPRHPAFIVFTTSGGKVQHGLLLLRASTIRDPGHEKARSACPGLG